MFDIFSVIIFSWLVFILARRFMVRTDVIDKQSVINSFRRELLALEPTLLIESLTAEQCTFRRGDAACVVQFGQLMLRCAEIPARSGEIIRLAAEDVISALQQHAASLENWREKVVPLLYYNAQQLPAEVLRDSFVDELQIVYVLNFSDSFRYLTENDLLNFGISRLELQELALENLERSCNRLEIDTPGPDSEGYERMLRFTTGDGLDATRLLIPSFFQRFSPRFDNTNLLVTIPTRDTLIMFSERDSTLAKMLSLRNSAEINSRAYPLYHKILLLDENAITPWYP